nr:dTDP-4-dehydrorhamnose reductase [Deinobacterium chartae]
MWVGVEATVNRIGDRFLDQLEHSGFARRLEDLDRLASLGARRLRFPLLWERTAPGRLEDARWEWSDLRLKRLRALRLEPIVGLMHHGSGPRSLSLVDPELPGALARYARAVAERYPWVDAYTPVNEPLTTARFSGLYGHWYPHARDDRTFLSALLYQLRGTALAMRAIRAVNPQARLVQTEDLGRTHSTPRLRYQADFENERRWLSFDLLCGRVGPEHPLWSYLLRSGIREHDLMWFAEQPCPPDIFGINAYVTSERFLDEHLAHYPKHTHGGNGRHTYADVEAVRVLEEPFGGFRARLRETHARYAAPIAVTETHLGCTREDQLRWLHETWQAALEVRAEGVDLRAVTVWSAFGAFDWDSLLTRPRGHYESGLWDLRAPEPRPTALVTLTRRLARGEPPGMPLLEGPGWWHRPERRLYGAGQRPHPLPAPGRPILITGAHGTLGQAIARACLERGLAYRLLTRAELDIADATSAESALDRLRPWAVINAAGYVRVDDAERDPRNRRENALGPQVLARACAGRDLPLVTFSSDLVFDGGQQRPYLESDAPAPLNAYGRSKHEAERAVLSLHPAALVIRTSAFFGFDPYNFAQHVLRELRARRPLRVARDQVITPTFVPDLAGCTLDLLIDAERGLWHLAHPEALSWYEFAQEIARRGGLEASLLEGVPSSELGQVARRPAYSALGSERGWIMPPLESALERFFAELPDLRAAAD